MNNNNTLASISLADLSSVTGGAASSTKQSAQIESSLATIQSSIKDLGAKKSDGGFDSTTMMCLGLMMAQRNKQNHNTVVAGPGMVASSWSQG